MIVLLNPKVELEEPEGRDGQSSAATITCVRRVTPDLAEHPRTEAERAARAARDGDYERELALGRAIMDLRKAGADSVVREKVDALIGALPSALVEDAQSTAANAAKPKPGPVDFQETRKFKRRDGGAWVQTRFVCSPLPEGRG